MPYTPDATNASQPTGNVQLSTAAAEFRAIKQRIIDIVTAQDFRDDTQDIAIGAAQSTANTAVSNAAAAQGTANTALANAATAQGTANTGVSNAAAAQGTADAAAASAATAQSAAQAALFTRFTNLTGLGNWTVPAGVTTINVIVRGASTAQGIFRAFSAGTNFNFISQAQAGEVKVITMSVTPGDSIPYGTGLGQQLVTLGSPTTIRENIPASDSFFFNTVARAGITRFYYDTGASSKNIGDDLSGYVWSSRTRGGLFDIVTSGFVNYSDMYQGDSGSVTVFY